MWHGLSFQDSEGCGGLHENESMVPRAAPFDDTLPVDKTHFSLPLPVVVTGASSAYTAAATTASLIVEFCLGREGEKREWNQRPLTGFLCPCSSWSQELMRVSSWNFAVQLLPEANAAFSLSARLMDLLLRFCELLSISRSQERELDREREREGGRAIEFHSAPPEQTSPPTSSTEDTDTQGTLH